MRVSGAIDAILRKERGDFRPGVGCIDHINYSAAYRVDLEKAFDSIHRDTLWNNMQAYGYPEKIVSNIKLFYNNFSCSVIHKKKLTD